MTERPSDRHALLFAAGQDVRETRGAIGKADRLQQLLDSLVRHVRRHLVELEHQSYVVCDGERRYQVERLVDEADVPAPEQRAIAFRETGQVDAGDDDPARVRRVDSPDQVEQRRLPRTAATAQRDDLAATNVGVDAIEHDLPSVAFLEVAAQTAELNFGVVAVRRRA